MKVLEKSLNFELQCLKKIVFHYKLWMTKIVATRCHILKLKCTKFDFGWGSAPDPAGGAYSANAMRKSAREKEAELSAVEQQLSNE